MDYKCQTIPLERLQLSPKGLLMPLCQTCKTFDCTNFIEKKKVSIAGEIRELKLLLKGGDYYMVVICEGYLNPGKR